MKSKREFPPVVPLRPGTTEGRRASGRSACTRPQDDRTLEARAAPGNPMSATTSICGACRKPFVATPRWIDLGGGLCRACAGSADGVPATCGACGNQFLWYPRFYQLVRHAMRPPEECPGCHDRAQGKTGALVALERRCLQLFPVGRVDLDLEAAPEQADGVSEGCLAPRHSVLKNMHNRSYEGRVDVYDYRPDGSRGTGTLARIRVMHVRHEAGRELTVVSGPVMGPKHEETLRFDPENVYLVLEPVDPEHQGKDAEVALVSWSWEAKHNAAGGVVDDRSHWSRILTSQSRSGRHRAGTVVAIVDDEHEVLVRQDHLVSRVGMTADLDECGFRDDVSTGAVMPSALLVGASRDTAERLCVDGWRARLVEAGVVVRLRIGGDNSFELPPPGDAATSTAVRLEAAEGGGALTSSGWAAVVCDLQGERVTPFGTSGWRGQQACGTHAWFAVPNGLVTVQAGWTRRSRVTVRLTRHHWVGTDSTGKIATDTLYEGPPEGLPAELSTFRAAVDAGCAKATTFHARGVYFSA